MPESKKAKAKGFLERNVPIPPHFYAQKNDDDLLIADKSVILPFTVSLQMLQLAAVVVFFVIYSLPMSYTNETRIESEYDYKKNDGWNCTPLALDSFYSTRFNYDTCKELYQEPSTTNVLEKTLMMGEPPSATIVYRYYPYYNVRDVGIALPSAYINDIETDEASQTPIAQEIFNSLKELNTCGDTGLGTVQVTNTYSTNINAFDIYPSVTGGGGPACTITQAEAIKMFAAYNLKADPCYYAKVNMPFSCLKSNAKPILERLSLSYANGLLLYTIISAGVVQAFFARSMKAKKEELKAMKTMNSGKEETAATTTV